MKTYTANTMHAMTVLLVCCLAGIAPAQAQMTEITDDLRTAWGFDVMVSEGGIGAGVFHWREFSPTIAAFINFSISEAKDSREVEMVDFWTGQRNVPGKINRFLVLPVHVGIQYRLFKDQIMDNFRPFLSVGLGPSLIYATPYEKGFFRALGYGKGYHTLGGFIGAGAYIGSDPTNLVGINFRYYFIPYFSGITSMVDFEKSIAENQLFFREMKHFGGFYLTFTFGLAR
jgi:hypothetical protein